MTPLRYGGPAFPCNKVNDSDRAWTDKFGYEVQPGETARYSGMTLRDYFAGIALQIQAARYFEGHEDGWEGVAEEAYDLADAMLQARRTLEPGAQQLRSDSKTDEGDHP
jgi:hypothetical protein